MKSANGLVDSFSDRISCDCYVCDPKRSHQQRVHHVTGCEVLVDEMLWPDSPSFGFLSIPNERPSKSWILINVENLNESPFIKATLHIVPCDLDIGQCSIQQEGLLSVQRKVYQLADENRDCALE